MVEINSTEPMATFSVQDTAKYLGLHQMTVYRLFKTKKLPAFKVGAQWRTKKEYLDQYASNQVKDVMK